LQGFLLHLHPKMVDEQAVKYSRTFGLGGINALLFILLAFTGLLLRFSYIPTPEGAYDSILALQNNSILGRVLRNIHHWSAVLMIITSFLHLIRVFYSQSIYHQRKKNWYYGLILFALVVSFNFTGYLLPWDQLSYWAVSIMTNILEYIPWFGPSMANLIRGGHIVNDNTLLNFYTFHTAIFPLLFVVFMVMHFWLVRKAKGVTVANQQEKKMVAVNPELIYKEILVGLILIIVVLLVSIFFNAPLLEKANPMISPNPSKAPWYFMGMQELLINLHPLFVSFILPIGLLVFFFYLAKANIEENKVGVWFYSENGKQITIVSAIFAAVLSFLLILFFEKSHHLNDIDLPLFIVTGIIPLLLYLIPMMAFLFYLKKKRKANNIELLIAVMTLIISSYILMSLVGIFLRGEGMHLIF